MNRHTFDHLILLVVVMHILLKIVCTPNGNLNIFVGCMVLNCFVNEF